MPNFLSVIRFFGLLPFLYIALYKKNYVFDSFFFGFFAYLINFYFLFYTFVEAGKINIFFSVVIIAVLCSYYAFQYPIIAYFTRIFYKWNKKLILLFPFMFLTIDFIYPKIFRHTIGDGLIGLFYFIQIIDITGMSGPVLIIMFSNLSIFYIIKYFLIKKRIPIYLYSFILLILLSFGYGIFRVSYLQKKFENSPVICAGLIQGNITGKDKMNPELYDTNIERYNELSKYANEEFCNPGVIIWPESIFSVSYDGTEESLKRLIYDDYGTVILGITYWKKENGETTYPKIYNSAILYHNGKVISRYDKRHLLMFGEYVPFEKYIPFLRYISPFSYSFTKGETSSIFKFENVKASMSICFESLFPDEIRKKVNEGSNLMINLTNDSWYGNTIGPVHHSAIARLRAIENRRSFFRVTATGITTASDPTGKIVSKAKAWEPVALYAEVPLYEGKSIYSFIGELFSYISIILVLVFIVVIGVLKIKNQIISKMFFIELGLQKRLGLEKNLGVKKRLGIRRIFLK